MDLFCIGSNAFIVSV